MSGDNRTGTMAEDYSSCYYNEAHLGGYDDYNWDNATWRGLFTHMAQRIVGLTSPATALDVGCAKGLLVQALAEAGVDASGIDISDHAIETAHPNVRPRLRVASATEPFEGRYDVVTCIEVLEHMSPTDTQRAIDNMCAASDRVVFSSSPGDHDEATHINTKPTAQWAAWFAERDFYRRPDADLSFMSPWAVLFERADLSPRSIVHRYESQYATLNTELMAKREALLEAHRRIGNLHEQVEAGVAPELREQAQLVEQWEAEVLDARHQLLTTRDHVVGTEAEVGRLTRDNIRLSADLARTRKQLTNVRDKLRRARRRANQQASRADRLRAELDLSRRNQSMARRAAHRFLGGGR